MQKTKNQFPQIHHLSVKTKNKTIRGAVIKDQISFKIFKNMKNNGSKYCTKLQIKRKYCSRKIFKRTTTLASNNSISIYRIYG